MKKMWITGINNVDYLAYIADLRLAYDNSSNVVNLRPSYMFVNSFHIWKNQILLKLRFKF